MLSERCLERLRDEVGPFVQNGFLPRHAERDGYFDSRRAEVRRATQTLSIAEQRIELLDIALNRLTLD